MNNVNAIDYINGIMISKNYMNTHGVIILNSGVMIKARNLFLYFKEMWNEYKLIIETGTDEEMVSFLRDRTNGGIVSNGEIDIYLPDVSCMISEFQIIENNIRNINRKPLDDFPDLIEE